MKRPALLLGLLLLAGPAVASPRGFGFQLGLAADPGDLLGGIHYIAPITRAIDLAPSVDVGTGGGDGALTLNALAHLNLQPDAEVAPYVGAGASWYSAGPSDDTSDKPDAAGPVLLGGVWFNRHGGTAYSFEGRFGFGDLPAFTAQLGVTF
jgi:hypothetical protein